jgi:hypothetical protein
VATAGDGDYKEAFVNDKEEELLYLGAQSQSSISEQIVNVLY